MTWLLIVVTVFASEFRFADMSEVSQNTLTMAGDMRLFMLVFSSISWVRGAMGGSNIN